MKNRNPATSMPEIIQQFSKLEECIFIKGGKTSKYFPIPKEAFSVIPPEAFETRLGGPDSSSASSFPFLEQAMCSSTDAVLAAEPEPAGVVPSHTAFLHVCGCCRECSLWQASNHLLFSTLLISFPGIFLAWSYVTTEVPNSLMKIKAVLGFYRCGTQPKT